MNTKEQPRFADIPQFTRSANYEVRVFWRSLEQWVEEQCAQGLDLDPDFQRGHVWTVRQQSAYVEFVLRGGNTGKDILTNHPGWQGRGSHEGPYVLVDGKQRLTAVLAFLRARVTAFGHKYSSFTDRAGVKLNLSFNWNVNDLQTRAEVLQWYLDLNTGGTVHADEEIEKVKALLAREARR
jgi:hypothetical protein